MKISVCYFGIFLLCCLSQALASDDSTPEKTFRGYVESVKERDFDGFSRSLISGKQFHSINSRGEITNGRKDYLDGHLAWFNKQNWSIEYESPQIAQFAESAYAMAVFHYRETSPDGKVSFLDAYFTLILVKEEGVWKVAADIVTPITNKVVNKSVTATLFRVPYGTHIMPNGIFGSDEWWDSKTCYLSNTVALHLKQDKQFVFVGIEFLKVMHTGIDLYLATPEGRRRKLHVSSALGDSEWQCGAWTEIQWGNSEYWASNSVGLIYVEGKQQVVPVRGFEFQISRDIFPSGRGSLLIHLKRPERIFPNDAVIHEVNTWLELLLN